MSLSSTSSSSPKIANLSGANNKLGLSAIKKTITGQGNDSNGADSATPGGNKEGMAYFLPGTSDPRANAARAAGAIAKGVTAAAESVSGRKDAPVAPINSSQMFAGLGDAIGAAGKGLAAMMDGLQKMKQQNQGKEGGEDAGGKGQQEPPPPPPPPQQG